MLKIFLDTEFTNFLDTELISIGMVAASGEEIYAEVPYPDHQCSAFVREAVIPQLNDYPNAFVCKPQVQRHILDWLRVIRPSGEDLQICYDYDTDWALFVDALNGSIPEWVTPLNVGADSNILLHFNFFKHTGLPEHHALYDARALYYSYRPK